MNAKRLLAHYERIADAPDAIAHMRRFILDLAVRGKLAPQDSKDEPASKLLKLIEKERARLVTAGEIRQVKTAKPADRNSLLFDIKAGWVTTTIEHVLIELQTGPFGSSLHQSDYQVGGIPVVNPASIQNEQIIPIEKMAVGAATLERLSAFKLRVGDIVMARRGEMGRCAVVTEREAGWLCGTGSLILRLPECVFGRFFVLLIGSPYVRNYLSGSAVGATMQNLNQGILLDLVIGLPPVAEQRRIVAKVDELMALCDRLEAARAAREATRNRLAAASLARLNTPDPETFQTDAHFALDALPTLSTRPDQIKQLRQTILNLAVRGKLVRQDPKDEPASELLKRIEKEKTNFGRIVSRGRRSEGRERKDEFVFALPPGWVVSTLGEIALKITDGAHQTPIYVASGVPFVSVKDFSGGQLKLSNTRYITEEEHRGLYERCDPKRGDILIGRIGTLGRAVLVDTDVEFSLFVSVGLIRFSHTNLSLDFFRLLLNSPLVEGEFDRIKIGGGTHTNKLNLGDLKTIALPVPPLAEQRRIVTKVDQLMTLCDRLEANLTAAGDTRRRLLDVLLAEALAPAEERELEAVA